MEMNAQDRVALLLGRAVMRAEMLQCALEEVQARIVELEAEKNGVAEVTTKKSSTSRR